MKAKSQYKRFCNVPYVDFVPAKSNEELVIWKIRCQLPPIETASARTALAACSPEGNTTCLVHTTPPKNAAQFLTNDGPLERDSTIPVTARLHICNKSPYLAHNSILASTIAMERVIFATR